MPNITDIIVIIPSYNPDSKLAELVDDLTANGFARIVIVNDGSAPECQPWFDAAAARKECHLLTHEKNAGKGRALKTAFSYCQNQKDCIGVITVDGDGQHLVKDIKACAEALRQNPHKVILGVRNFEEPHVPARSKLGNLITRTVFRLLCGLKISDTQTGLRAVPMEHLSRFISYQGERYEYETNMLLMMPKDHIEWEEVKISTVYLDDNARSHFHPIKDSVKIYKIILKNRNGA